MYTVNGYVYTSPAIIGGLIAKIRILVWVCESPGEKELYVYLNALLSLHPSVRPISLVLMMEWVQLAIYQFIFKQTNVLTLWNMVYTALLECI